MKVAIIGAGIVGIMTAHAMLDKGYAVTLIDPEGLAERTSKGNAGHIAHTDILPLAGPKVWRHLPRWLIDPLGPLAIRPSYALSIAPWMVRFLLASRPSRIELSTQALIALQALTLPAWEKRLAALGLTERHFRRKGFIGVFRSAQALAASRATIERQKSIGVSVEILPTSSDVRRLEPALSDRAAAGVFFPDGVHVDDPAGLSKAMGEAALRRGAVLKSGEVASIAPVEGGVAIGLKSGETLTAESVVIAAGAWSKSLAQALGDAIPLDTERGYNVTLPKGSLGLSRPIYFDGLGFVTTPLDVGDRIGGAVEFGGLTAEPNYKRVDAMIARARPFLPDAKFEGGTRWMGHRPSLPDSLPVIGRSRASDRIVYAFGHGHYGLTQSAATGDLAAQLVGQQKTAIDLTPFWPDRFRA